MTRGRNRSSMSQSGHIYTPLESLKKKIKEGSLIPNIYRVPYCTFLLPIVGQIKIN